MTRPAMHIPNSYPAETQSTTDTTMSMAKTECDKADYHTSIQ